MMRWLFRLISVAGIASVGLFIFGDYPVFATSYSITYNDGVVSNMPIDIIGESVPSAPISSLSPVRTSFLFKGWCTTTPTGGGSQCTGTTYQPSSSYTLTGTTNDIVLYAMWGGTFDQAYNMVGKTQVTVNGVNYYTLQDMTPDVCNAVSQGETTTVVDTRDNQLYRVGKLADNRCWMLDNLALDLVNTDIANLKGKTNASDISLEYLKGTRTGTTTDQYPTAGVASWTSGTRFSIPLVNLVSKDTVPQGANDPLAAETLAGNWKVGGYYNYCAASAGTYCWGNGTNYTNSPTTDPNSGTTLDVTEDICPLGWRMPIGTTAGEYRLLFLAIAGDRNDFRKALYMPLSGGFNGDGRHNLGVRGYYWSATWFDTNRMSYVYMVYDSLNTYDKSSRANGSSVRCIAK